MLTNLDKIFWKRDGYTKGDVIEYYEKVAKTILPYLKNRPMVLNRHPNGIDGKSFFQKNNDITKLPSWVETVAVPHKDRTIRYLLVQDKETLIYVANLGCIELNPFHARISSLDKPDYLLIDLDPESVHFDRVIEAAHIIRQLLDDLGLRNYCKTSGGRGLHIYVPLNAQYDFAQAQTMAKLIALLAQEKLPKLISLERSPARRQKRIYVDFPRNSQTQTIAAPYCLRPRPHAPVSTPLDWKEVKPGLDPLEFNIESVPGRIKKVGDLFKPVIGRGVNLQRGLERLKKIIS